MGLDGHFLASEQDMPVDPPEDHLPVMVDLGVFQQSERSDSGKWESSGQGLCIVIEVDQGTLTIPSFDIAVGMAVEFGRQRPILDGVHDILKKDLSCKMSYRTRLGSGYIRRITKDKYVFKLLGLQGFLIVST